MQSKFLILSWILIFSFCSCKQEYRNSGQDTQKDSAIAEIMKLHRLQRDYHFNKNADDFVEILSDDYISVNRGEISHPSKAANTERFSHYFSSVEFQKWDDIEPPIIKFSQDSTLAYTIVHKQVELTSKDSTGTAEMEKVEYAWLAIYRKSDDGWKIECSVSTNK